MSNNSKQWSSATPGYIIFLIDQSGSMGEDYAEGKKKAEYTAMVINSTINEIIMSCMDGDKIKDRVFISLIGYGGNGGNSVDDIRSDYVSAFGDFPIRLEKVRKKISNGAGGLVEIEEDMPIFLEPVSNGLTPMGEAFKFAKQLIEGWMQRKPNNPAPVIINISDGFPYNGNQNNPKEEELKAIEEAKLIMDIETEDGHPIIFNVHIGTQGKECIFSASESELEDGESVFLFKVSSIIPDEYKKSAAKYDIAIKQNGKGFISNARPENLIKLINIGTSGTGGADKTSF